MTTVLFFHHLASLPEVLASGQELARQARDSMSDEDALAVGFARPAGTWAWSVQPWNPPTAGGGLLSAGQDAGSSPSAADLFSVFTRDRSRVLSPQLAAALERDNGALAALGSHLRTAEIRRLARQHGGDAADGDALARLSLSGQAMASSQRGPGRVGVPAPIRRRGHGCAVGVWVPETLS